MPPSRSHRLCLLPARDEDAAPHARKAIDGNPNFALAYCVLAIASARLGRSAEAAQAITRLIALAPRFRGGALRRIRFADAARLQPDLDLLRAAGLPDQR